MSVADIITFDKDGEVDSISPWRRYFLALVIILVAVLSFGIGRLTGGGKSDPVRIEYDSEISNSQFPISNEASAIKAINPTGNSKLKIENSTQGIVASKNSNKYHYSHCPGAKQIKEANKITFATTALAEAAGYVLAANCVVR